MRKMMVNLKRHLTALKTAIAGFVLLPGLLCAEIAPADLLGRLGSASPDEAPRIAREVEAHWAKSGSAAMDVLLRRGREAMKAADYALAIEHFTALTDHAPAFAEGFHARAEAYYRADLYGPALSDLEQALALDPTHYEAIFGLAVMVHEFGRLRRAEALYRRVLTIHPNHENALAALARLQREGVGREL